MLSVELSLLSVVNSGPKSYSNLVGHNRLFNKLNIYMSEIPAKCITTYDTHLLACISCSRDPGQCIRCTIVALWAYGHANKIRQQSLR